MAVDRRQRYLDSAAATLLARHVAPRKALFLDRDGIINVNHGHVCTIERTDWIPGCFELCRGAEAAGYLSVVVTNQAGIARGLYDEAQYLAFTRWIHAEFASRGAPLLATYHCPHHPTAGSTPLTRECECRKPGPGMFLQALADFDIEPGASLMIGDKASDLQGAAAAGIQRGALFTGDELPTFDKLLTDVENASESGSYPP